MTRKIFTKLFGLFIVLLVIDTAVMEFIFSRTVETPAGATLRLLGREALWFGIIVLAIALPIAAWAASRITRRLERVVAFARRVAEGDLSARLALRDEDDDEIASMKAVLNHTAERFGQSLAELESRRQELATMLDSMQEAVVAITPEGYVRWSNAVMRRIAGTQIHPGRPLVHAVRDPEVLACISAALKNSILADACGRFAIGGLVAERHGRPNSNSPRRSRRGVRCADVQRKSEREAEAGAHIVET